MAANSVAFFFSPPDRLKEDRFPHFFPYVFNLKQTVNLAMFILQKLFVLPTFQDHCHPIEQIPLLGKTNPLRIRDNARSVAVV